MSVARRADRRTTRNHQSSPYARPATPKKSSWGLSSLLNYILPTRSRTSVVETSQEEQPESSDSAARTFSVRGHLMLHDLNSENPTPPNTATQDIFLQPAQSGSPSNIPITPYKDISLPSEVETPSPAKNLETVAAFLAQKAGQPLNQIEAAGLVALINQSTDHDDKPEPFRFSSSPPTPARGNSPNVDFSTSDVSYTTSSPSPRKTLSKNPNGVYRWEGGGSARPRNRYRSPAFGSPPPSPRIKLSPPESLKTDTKRRRVGDDASNTPPVQSPSIPPARSGAPSPPSRPAVTPAYPFPVSDGTNPPNNGSSVNGTSVPRLRTTGFSNKPTTPAIPSPLRQAWGQSEPFLPPAAKPTKAADFMTELIKEVTPPRRPDVSNPYQTASPVKSPIRKPTRRPRATGKPTLPPAQLKEPQPEITPQAIIEATVPKGSKRSRPPPNVDRRSQVESASNVSSSNTTMQDNLQPERHAVNGNAKNPDIGVSPSPIVVEEVDNVQEDERTTKKRKKIPVEINNTQRSPSVTVEEIDDVDMPLASAPIRPTQIIEIPDQVDSKPSRPASGNTHPQNVPGPSQGNNRSSFVATKSSAPKEPSKLRFSYQPDVLSGEPGAMKPKPRAEKDPKEAALAMAVDELPSFTFPLDKTSSSFVAVLYVMERNAAVALPSFSLPKFDFSTPSEPTFDWAAAGMKVSAKAGSWTCSLCMLTNPGSVVDKCTVCEAPRPGQETKTEAAGLGFNWAAAGTKPPPSVAGGTWACSTCMLSNPATAVDKCTVCEAPR